MRTCVEVCAGARGQVRGLESAGFEPLALVEIGGKTCDTLRMNCPSWNVTEGELGEFSGAPYKGVNLLAGGVPCPPFSIASRQLRTDDQRDLFPAALRVISEARPKAIIIENMRGFFGAVFEDYRKKLKLALHRMEYHIQWRLLSASDFGLSQLCPRVVIFATSNDTWEYFSWPMVHEYNRPTVGQTLLYLAGSRRCSGATRWHAQANDIAPTIVGGPKKHGGPERGPTKARRAGAPLGVDGSEIAGADPGPKFVGMPGLTIPTVARLQGFPDSWRFAGGETPAYRQVSNAFTPPVAAALAGRSS